MGGRVNLGRMIVDCGLCRPRAEMKVLQTSPTIAPGSWIASTSRSAMHTLQDDRFSALRRRSVLNSDTHFVQVPQQVGRILVHPVCTGAFEFILAVTT